MAQTALEYSAKEADFNTSFLPENRFCCFWFNFQLEYDCTVRLYCTVVIALKIQKYVIIAKGKMDCSGLIKVATMAGFRKSFATTTLSRCPENGSGIFTTSTEDKNQGF